MTSFARTRNTPLTSFASSPNLPAAEANCAERPSSASWNPLAVVRETCAAHSLDVLAGMPPTADSLTRAAARALDLLDTPHERAIAQLPLPDGESIQARFDTLGLQAFRSAIQTRDTHASRIRVDDKALLSALRGFARESQNVIPDVALLGALSPALLDRLRRSLCFSLPEGAARSSDEPVTSAQILEAMTRMRPLWQNWLDLLRGQVLAPVIASNQQRRDSSLTSRSQLAAEFAAASPAQLVARLDALDACSEDALLYSARAALSAPDSETLGVARADWERLHLELDVRERAARAGILQLDEMAQALQSSDLPHPGLDRLAVALADSALMTRLLRACATERRTNPEASSAETLRTVVQRMQAEPGNKLSALLARSAELHNHLHQTQPALGHLLDRIIADALAHNARLREDPANFSETIEHALIDHLEGHTSAPPSEALDTLAEGIQKLRKEHSRTFADTLGLLWTNRIQLVLRSLHRRVQTLASSSAVLGLDAESPLAKRLHLAAIDKRRNISRAANECFSDYASMDAPTQARIKRAALGPNGRPTTAAANELGRLRRGNGDEQRLADLLERQINRMRAHDQRNAKPATKEADDDALLDQAILDARRAPSVEAEIDRFLTPAPKLGSEARRLNDLSARLNRLTTPSRRALMLELAERHAAEQVPELFARYKKRSAIENWFLNEALPSLGSFNKLASRRIEIAGLRDALIQRGLAPIDAWRALMCLDSASEVSSAIHLIPATPQSLDEATEAACDLARSLFEHHATALAGLPDVGPLMQSVWEETLNRHAWHHRSTRLLKSAIEDPARIKLIASERFDALLKDNEAGLTRAAKNPALQEKLGQLIEQLSWDILGELKSSPAVEASYALCKRLALLER